MSSKLFTIAGTSILNGQLTFRFATGTIKKRAWILYHNGHKEVMLEELPEPMTKEDAVKFLTSRGVGRYAIVPGTKRYKPIDIDFLQDLTSLPPEIIAFIEDVVEAFKDSDWPQPPHKRPEWFGPSELFGPPMAPKLTRNQRRKARTQVKTEDYALPNTPAMLIE